MTGPARGRLTVILAAALPVQPVQNGQPGPDGQPGCGWWNEPLCGRPAADWLLDTVTAIRPDAVGFAGCGAAAVRERAEARPALRRVLAAAPGTSGGRGGQPDVTLVLSCLNPLLQPGTIRRALRMLTEDAQQVPGDDARPATNDTALRAVLICSRTAARWWSDSAGSVTAAAVAYTGGPGDCPAWLAQLEPADARTLRSRLRGLGAQVATTDAGPVESLRGGDPADRPLAEAALYQKIAVGWQRKGVIIDDPATTRIDSTVRIGTGTRIKPNTELAGRTVIGAGASIGPVTTLLDTTAGDGCLIRYAVCERVTIGDSANIGPFCWLRSGTRMGARTRAGAFVELADSVVGDETKIPHCGGLLSAVVGKGCNIGAFSGPANFDGQSRHRVEIGDHVSVGPANIMIAPISIGDGAYTAAGTIITEDVPSGALAIGRSRQRNVDGWVARKLPGTAAAMAAARAAANGTAANGTAGNGTDGNGTAGNGTDGNGTAGNGTAASDSASASRASNGSASAS
jgi:acetyltransferase-like isoleucine patch superfamily enzyme